ncbi:hypothetical protein [Mesorhizobium koreense]|uniref:hypothetical protein n=1 Tax=Mesorhizobium koreense TaxID=3074855 RepID=UPI00287B9F4C|nr:hypothetical protein [Mesorhizobium sp. WR6]
MTPATMIAFDGIEQPVTEWALDYGIAPAVIIARLERGMPVAEAITKPMVAARGQKLSGEHIDSYVASQRRVWWRDRRKVRQAVGKARRDSARAAERRVSRPKKPYRPPTKVRLYAFNGKTMTIGQWADEMDISISTLTKRFANGWPVERALTEETTADAKAKRHTFNGETLTLRQWSERTGLASSVIDTRLRKGWPMERALTAPVDERMRRRRGVGRNLAESQGTGGHPFAQESAKLEISE